MFVMYVCIGSGRLLKEFNTHSFEKHVCLCACMVYVYVCMLACVHMCAHVCMVYVYVCMLAYVHMCVWFVCVCACVCTHVHVRVCVCACVCFSPRTLVSMGSLQLLQHK